MKSILVLLHSGSNIGYAIAPLERTFYEMALRLTDGDTRRIHFAYKHFERGAPSSLPRNFDQYIAIDGQSTNQEHHVEVERYIREHDIDTLFGFDQPVLLPIYDRYRMAGVERFVSYWGAPMSSVKPWPVRLAKRLGVILSPGPDHYIFESHGMAELAIKGRGIPKRRTSVVHLGVDTERFRPDPADASYVYEQLCIPRNRRIFFYSGHFEPRKGVAVIMEAANRLTGEDWHIVLCGNKADQATPYAAMLHDPSRVTFAGYRDDIARLQRGCYAAIIASTGWDSFPRSGMEMQATGLPLLASDLIGLRESVEDGVSGMLFQTGNADALANAMRRLLSEPSLRDRLSCQARGRIERSFSLEVQIRSLVEIVRNYPRRGAYFHRRAPSSPRNSLPSAGNNSPSSSPGYQSSRS